MKENEELLTIDEVVERYKISKYNQKIFRDKHSLPYSDTPGKAIYYKKVLLDMWLRQYSVNEAAEDTA